MNDNNDGKQQKGEGKRLKMCPLLKEYCIEGRCALFTEMTRNAGGLQQKFGLCSFNAMVMMLSEMNMKAQPPQQKMQIPNLIRG